RGTFEQPKLYAVVSLSIWTNLCRLPKDMTMPINKSIIITGLFVVAGISSAMGADIERGKLLYENHCQFCHSIKIHSRKNRWPKNLDELRGIVDLRQRQTNLHWSKEDIDDVVDFLNTTQYNY